jgi:hypothetical protein
MQVEGSINGLRAAAVLQGVVPPTQGPGVSGITSLKAAEIDLARWPLFLTVREWLVLLDATLLGDKFCTASETSAALNGTGSAEQGTLPSIGK